jgi:hypothetical protein
MKKYIREMLDDLNRKKKKDSIPPIPLPSSKAPTLDLNVSLEPVVPGDLSNAELSSDPAESVRQQDFQAQENEERETP